MPPTHSDPRDEVPAAGSQTRPEARPEASPEATLNARLDAAIAAHEQGRIAEARPVYEEALRRDPGNAVALHMLGLAQLQSGQEAAGLQLLRASLQLQPRNAAFHLNLGKALQAAGQRAPALAAFEAALALRPELAAARSGRAALLQELGRTDESVAALRAALEQQPEDPELHCRLGIALGQQQASEPALAHLERAVALAPGYGEAWFCRGIALQRLDRPAAAEQSYARALALNPRHAKAWSNRGTALQVLGRTDEALACFEQAVACDPTLADAHWNYAVSLLLNGRLEEGFARYEWRWKAAASGMKARPFAQPLWLGGEPLAGRTILLHAEQGMGDTLQFCRYAPLVAAQAARVVLVVPTALRAIMGTLEGVREGRIEVLAFGDALPATDFHCPLLSLPLALGTRLDTIPAPVPYLRTDGEQVQAWAARLGPRRRPRVGLAWSGSNAYGNDAERSIPLAQLLPWLPPGLDYISLQREVRAEDLPALELRPDIRQYGLDLGDFAHTGALMELLDLVVSVDTSMGHLAGALGRPFRTLLSVNPNWRWMLGRDDSPWYPSARLYRAHAHGDWSGALEPLHAELRALAGGG